MLSISVNLEDFNNVYKVANSYDNIYCTTGIHPNNVPENKNNELLFEKLSLNLNKKKVIGVGETGLDFYRNEENRINQIEYFNTHLEVSGLLNYPTIVHTRNAEKDTINCIEKAVKKHSTKGLNTLFYIYNGISKKSSR